MRLDLIFFVLMLSLPAASTATPPESTPGPAAAYQEERFGPWVLRSDPRAHTFGVVLIPTGVIELAARSADGLASWIIRDNGTILAVELTTPPCTTHGSPASYDSVRASVLFRGNCPMGEYRPAVAEWAETLAPALAAMRERARAMWPDRLQRCVPPPPPVLKPDEIWIPPHHPPCGFPPPEIGQNHAP